MATFTSTDYEARRKNAKIFEDLAWRFYKKWQSRPSFTKDEEKELDSVIEELRLLALETKPLSYSVCKRIVKEIRDCVNKASDIFVAGGNGHKNYFKMVMFNIRMEVKSMVDQEP
ncbi:hypothetical protein HDK64DRAFT_257702 [Phyllosticta capitalensis]|uniref:Uncharacterized protein n=1 Tax=Phyllosticta capitalensis TaxID=121624 RepID=A0ABR1YD06_9PEZI